MDISDDEPGKIQYNIKMQYPFVDFDKSEGSFRQLRVCDDQFVGAGDDENWNRDDEEGVECQRCTYVAVKECMQRPLESASGTFDVQKRLKHTFRHESILAGVKPIVYRYNHSQ